MFAAMQQQMQLSMTQQMVAVMSAQAAVAAQVAIYQRGKADNGGQQVQQQLQQHLQQAQRLQVERQLQWRVLGVLLVLSVLLMGSLGLAEEFLARD